MDGNAGSPPVRISSCKRIHIVGIAGSGLSGMARLLVSRGIDVSGSEMKDSPMLETLGELGVKCSIGHDAENLRPGTDLVAITAAVGDDNPEVAAAKKKGIRVLKYAQLVGLLMSERKGIAVAGTHGKTTTTSMVASILAGAGLDPGFIIGGEYPGLGGGSGWGSGEYFVAEACEFDRSFLNLRPRFAIVTNIEEDHLDYFRSLADIQEAFSEFIGRLPPDGCLVSNADDPGSAHLRARSPAPVITFSLRPGEGSWWAEAVRPAGAGIRFRALGSGGDSAEVCLSVPGIHNVKNSLAAIALLRRIGLGIDEIVSGLSKFGGARRRFEILLREPVTVIDDYAHHPTEIEAVLRAARETFPGRRIRFVFQPHQHSRTRRFLSGFADVLAGADEAMIAEVFRARDSNEEVRLVNSDTLAQKVRERGGNVGGGRTFDEIFDHLRETWSEGDVIVCLGAGNITSLARQLADMPWVRSPAAGVVVS
jgi:UDP-N-acetylmuramate--alanine ligase